MTSRDFITAESTNVDRIILYREGLFWKAYERSAYALCSQIRPLKPTRKALKVLGGGDLISVGFPSASESAVLAGLSRLEAASDRLVVAAPRPIDCEAFAAWKSSVPVKVPTPRKPLDPAVDSADMLSDVSAVCERGGAAGSSGSGAAAASAASAGSGVSAVSAGRASEPSRASWLRRVLRLFRACHVSAGGSDLSPEDDTARRIVRSLKDFNLADKTPMECMLFISELKNMLVNR